MRRRGAWAVFQARSRRVHAGKGCTARSGGGSGWPGGSAGAQVRARGAGWQLLAADELLVARLGERMWREVGGRERRERKGEGEGAAVAWEREQVVAARVGGMAGFMGPGGPARLG
jgi:hypothetical protein